MRKIKIQSVILVLFIFVSVPNIATRFTVHAIKALTHSMKFYRVEIQDSKSQMDCYKVKTENRCRCWFGVLKQGKGRNRLSFLSNTNIYITMVKYFKCCLML